MFSAIHDEKFYSRGQSLLLIYLSFVKLFIRHSFANFDKNFVYRYRIKKTTKNNGWINHKCLLNCSQHQYLFYCMNNNVNQKFNTWKTLNIWWSVCRVNRVYKRNVFRLKRNKLNEIYIIIIGTEVEFFVLNLLNFHFFIGFNGTFDISYRCIQ